MFEKSPLLPVTRRAALAGLAASVTVPASSASSPSDPDSELTRLAAMLDEHVIAVRELDAVLASLHKRAAQEMVRRFGSTRQVPIEDRFQIWRDLGVTEANDRRNTVGEAGDKISGAIKSIPARGLTGVVAKAKSLAWDLHLSPQFVGDPSQMDFDPQMMLRFIEELQSMAARS